MVLDNGILHLELTNKGGEMASLTYKGLDVLYKGDTEYWSGKNPTLFPFISSPNAKEYVYNNITYPCRNHGLIRYSTLETIKDDGSEVKMKLVSNQETLKEYPFNFEYIISYRLDKNRVLIDYSIKNTSKEIMPFTFGLHPGFLVRDFSNYYLEFKDDEYGIVVNQKDRSEEKIKLGKYTNFINDVTRLDTVILKGLKSQQVSLVSKEYTVTVDMKNFKYLALWTPNKDSNFMCIEPWLSINEIKTSNNPFNPNFELEYLKPNETYSIGYSIKVE